VKAVGCQRNYLSEKLAKSEPPKTQETKDVKENFDDIDELSNQELEDLITREM
jgi:hypothetical protein